MHEGGTVVVTGATGFIGRACVPELAARGYRVRGLVRTLDGRTAARAEYLAAGDLATADLRVLRNALRGAGAVVHLAARAHRLHDDAADPAGAYRAANVDATRRLAEAAVAEGVAHFVLASTVKVNGESTRRGYPFRESDPPDPHDAYAKSKWMAEQALAAVAEASGMRATALRLPLVYGPGARANLASLARAVGRRLPLPFAAVDNRRSLLGLANLCDAIAVAIGSDDAAERGRLTPYFVADGTPVSTPELVRSIAQAMRVAPRLFAVPPPWLRFAAACAGRAASLERLVGSLEVDTGAFRTRFGWTPPVAPSLGLAAAFGSDAPL